MKTRRSYLFTMIFLLALTGGCTDSGSARACDNDDDCARDWSCNPVEGQDESVCEPNADADCDPSGAAACEGADAGADAGAGADGRADAGTDADAETPFDGPRLHTDPQAIDFSRQDPGDPDDWGQDRFLTVQNTGSAPLHIRHIYISGSSDFSWSIPDPDHPARENDSEEWPSSLAPGDSFDIRINFRPDDSLPESAELIFESDDPDQPEASVTLNANSSTPCIRVYPNDQLQFWGSSIYETTRKSVAIENCSRGVNLAIDQVRITDDANGAYILFIDSLPDTVEPGEMIEFDVGFAPTEELEYNGELSILSDDPSREDVRLPLNGSGKDNVCPTAVADASVQGQTSSGDWLQTSPLSTVQLDGTASSDPDGPIARYQWTILSRPQGSTQRPTPDARSERPELFVDVAGTYEIELRVFDESGMLNCGKPARVTVNAVPEPDVYVELVWDTPSDQLPNDTTGSDLDLHYLHSNGTWTEAPWDIYSENGSADWGAQGDTADDPSLEREDDDGTGPEVVSHSGLKSGVDYRVGAHYSDANSLGTSYASVRIYVGGTLEFEHRGKEMSATGDFWDVASIRDGGASIISIDQLHQGYP